ncbi:hypothetical protein [Bosea sp. 124]|uniref:hypothetical protein n=1 Tax=Bosea sp. 124 TaxID=2135642 RepID=UPI001AECEA1A|nr:hypothetical protein [Bosea sp. 124]
MIELSLPAAPAASRLRCTLMRVCAGIALLGAVGLWLWALPALLRQDGLTPRDGAICRHGGYRDPVTGRPLPPSSARTACPAAVPGGRP